MTPKPAARSCHEDVETVYKHLHDLSSKCAQPIENVLSVDGVILGDIVPNV